MRSGATVRMPRRRAVAGLARKGYEMLWVRNYANIEIYDSKEGHWGRGQTGFNLSLSGRVFLFANRSQIG